MTASSTRASKAELLAELKVLQQENLMLQEKTEEFLLLLVTGRLLDQGLADEILFSEMVERIAVFLDIPLCAVGNFSSGEFQPLELYSLHWDLDASMLNVKITEAQLMVAMNKLQVLTLSELSGQGVTIQKAGHIISLTNLILIHIKVTPLREYIFLMADDRPSPDKLKQQLHILEEVTQKVEIHLQNQALQRGLESKNQWLGSAVKSQSKLYQESEAQFRMVMEQSPQVIEIYDMDGFQVSVNRAYEKLWGFSADTSLGTFNLFKSEAVKSTGLLAYVKRAYKGESLIVPEYEFDSRGETEAKGRGRKRWLSTQIYPLKTIEGQVRNIVISHEDITDRKIAELQILESEAKYKGLFDHSVDAIFILDPQGNYLDANIASEEILGYTVDELKQMNVKDIVHPDDLNKSGKYLQKLETDGFYKGYEGRVITKSGDIRYVEVSSIAIKMEGKMTGSHDIVRDITNRKIREAARELLP